MESTSSLELLADYYATMAALAQQPSGKIIVVANKKLWFKRRRYGWGWTPVRWQGWLTVFIFVSVVIAASTILKDTPMGSPTPELGVYSLILFVATAILLSISSKYGPEPKWRWGKRSDDNPDEDI